MAKNPTSTAAKVMGGRSSIITAAPRSIAEAAIPSSTPGRGTPSNPNMPPHAITIGNATGSAQLRAPQPDRDHGDNVVEAGDGMLHAAEKTGGFSFIHVSLRCLCVKKQS